MRFSNAELLIIIETVLTVILPLPA